MAKATTKTSKPSRRIDRPKRSGGARPGAGRPKGSKASAPYGTRLALTALAVAKRRLGDQVDPAAEACLERVYQRVIDVLEELVEPSAAPSVLKAAALLADSVAGPLKQKVGLEGAAGEPLTVSVQINAPAEGEK